MTWQRWLGIAVGILCLMGVSYAFGRYAQPAKIKTHEMVKTVTQIVKDTTAESKLSIVQAELDSLKKSSRVVHTVIVYKDGTRKSQTVTEKEIVDVKEASQVIATVSSLHEDLHSTVQQSASVRTETSNSKPDWRLGPMVGFSSQGVSYGVILERRIVGPVSLGAWGLVDAAHTRVEGGAVLTLEF